MGKDTAGAVGLSTFFGAISSSCSYPAASMARTFLVKGATWANAVSFMILSTNLVFEILIVIVTLLGWPFFGGEVIGGLLLIQISALLIKLFFSKSLSEVADTSHHNDDHAHHHGHDHSNQKLSFLDKIKAATGHFYMDVMMVGKDIIIGVALSAVLMVLVPESFWKSLFLTGQSHLPHLLVLAHTWC